MLSQTLYRLGRLAARRPWAVITSWLVLAALVVGASSAFGAKLEDSFRVPGLDSQQANDLLEAAGSGQAGVTAVVAVTSADGGVLDAGAVARLQRDLAGLPHVLGTTDPAGVLAGTSDEPGVVSPDDRVALIRVQYPTLDELSPADLAALKAVEGDPSLRVEKGGDLYFAYEESAANAGELVGILAALAILLLAFGSFVAAALPIGMAVLGLAIGVSAMPLLGQLMVIPSYAPVLGAMVGLGVGIDYALFVVTRHREHLARGVPVEESIARSMATAGRPVVFAGGIVVVSILGLAVAQVPFMTAGGVAIALVVLIMVAASVTLLPALLAVAGRRVVGRRPAVAASPGWARWTRHVTRHPRAYLVAGTALLLALAAPVVALRVGIPDDGALPPSRTERQAYDLVAQGFGPGHNGPLVVAVEGDASILPTLAAAIADDPGVADVDPPVVRGDIGTIVAYPTTGPQEKATYDTVERLRAEVFPAALAGTGAQAHVGGQAANFADVGVRVNDRLPAFVGAVLAMSFLLLMLVFRSVLVPLKAVLLNLLSIGASYGVMVMVFQWGWGADLIGLEATVPIVSFIPMFMFAILFGLSMDYEVFLLSRVREEYAATGSSTEAVVSGVAKTGRVITSAALIMGSVFLAFVLGEDAATKMFGVGLATAILLDATLVRMVLVPATMTLLGRANWWLPGWLDRLLPRVDVDAEDRLPELAVVRVGG
ncbi:MMPL family transporter [Cellulomonas sp. PhB150]|uniref:MMPL family transporter n=1 Tax=Cellulomonas sp. PhB150 TaxID=2485188 RepID=UPI000FC1B8AC|nr:MMPL family transporter [Cellulomonas sp. PhB150]ROS23779.1 RND superfamily putative drug exporter [Cellulomonas sp. PhB150]